MHPRTHGDQGRLTPAQRCSQYDFGGGVTLGDAFAIYSVVAFPPNWNSINYDPDTQGELTDALSSVTRVLPIYVELPESALGDIRSLATPRQQSTTSPRNHLPMFLMNAARSRKHCVLGHRTAEESLLRILQRPWCVLELCCCQTSIVVAVQNFASAASRIDRDIYDPANQLLSYELARRSELRPSDLTMFGHLTSQRFQSQASSASWPESRAIYTALSPSRLLSHNPFWIGVLCACAVYLGVSISHLSLMLWSPPGVSPSTMTPQFTRDHKLHGRLSSIMVYRSISRRTRTACLRRWKSDSDLRGGFPVKEHQPRGDAEANGTVKCLLDLYAALIRAMSDTI
ncbi:hypothetical protein N7492_009155 [Penicillium capsulatum]|uniref:Uncharacterized protein n=1 Tax=Penicillium capsulatum TaxID=69766 RepID=A0A9W9HTF5_9EURO|nr:hypothetical protein N7492_009155 [Penicillium capsulatum]